MKRIMEAKLETERMNDTDENRQILAELKYIYKSYRDSMNELLTVGQNNSKGGLFSFFFPNRTISSSGINEKFLNEVKMLISKAATLPANESNLESVEEILRFILLDSVSDISFEQSRAERSTYWMIIAAHSECSELIKCLPADHLELLYKDYSLAFPNAQLLPNQALLKKEMWALFNVK